jgi:hypothetical protein
VYGRGVNCPTLTYYCHGLVFVHQYVTYLACHA